MQEDRDMESVEEPVSTGDAAEANGLDRDLESETARLRDELQAAQDQVLRKAAEFQNYRRRTEEEKRLMVDIGKGVVVESLLDVVDDFSRMLDAADSVPNADGSLRTGIDMVYRKLMDELRKHGVHAIEAEGARFDENVHEAIMRQPAPEGVEAGTVLQEVQRGYMMNGRVLRHARVIVASDEA